MELPAILSRLLGPLQQRVTGMVARAALRLVDDAPAIQRGQIERRAGEVMGGVEIVWPPGLRANVGSGEVVALSLGGSPNHLVALPMGTKGGPDLAAGDVAVFSPGGFVHLKANGEVWVRGNGKVVLRRGEAGHWISIREDGIRSSVAITVGGAP